MGLVEETQTFLKDGELVFTYVRCAASYALAGASGRRENYSAYSKIEQLMQQLASFHGCAVRQIVAECKEESVAYRLLQILVICDVESVTQQGSLDLLGAACILAYILTELVLSVTCGLEPFFNSSISFKMSFLISRSPLAKIMR